MFRVGVVDSRLLGVFVTGAGLRVVRFRDFGLRVLRVAQGLPPCDVN